MSSVTAPAGQAEPACQLPGELIGAVLGVLALFFFPTLFGNVGAILDGVGYARGDEPFGLYVAIGALVAMVLDFVLAAVLSTRPAGPRAALSTANAHSPWWASHGECQTSCIPW